MTTPTMSDQQLLDYSSEHLLHELSMLWELAESLPQRKASTETSTLVESYGIHLRNVIDFFYRKGKRDDVTAKFSGRPFYLEPKRTDLTYKGPPACEQRAKPPYASANQQNTA
jgi:hypothetical protein